MKVRVLFYLVMSLLNDSDSLLNAKIRNEVLPQQFRRTQDSSKMESEYSVQKRENDAFNFSNISHQVMQGLNRLTRCV